MALQSRTVWLHYARRSRQPRAARLHGRIVRQPYAAQLRVRRARQSSVAQLRGVWRAWPPRAGAHHKPLQMYFGRRLPPARPCARHPVRRAKDIQCPGRRCSESSQPLRPLHPHPTLEILLRNPSMFAGLGKRAPGSSYLYRRLGGRMLRTSPACGALSITMPAHTRVQAR